MRDAKRPVGEPSAGEAVGNRLDARPLVACASTHATMLRSCPKCILRPFASLVRRTCGRIKALLRRRIAQWPSAWPADAWPYTDQRVGLLQYWVFRHPAQIESPEGKHLHKPATLAIQQTQCASPAQCRPHTAGPGDRCPTSGRAPLSLLRWSFALSHRGRLWLRCSTRFINSSGSLQIHPLGASVPARGMLKGISVKVTAWLAKRKSQKACGRAGATVDLVSSIQLRCGLRLEATPMWRLARRAPRLPEGAPDSAPWGGRRPGSRFHGGLPCPLLCPRGRAAMRETVLGVPIADDDVAPSRSSPGHVDDVGDVSATRRGHGHHGCR